MPQSDSVLQNSRLILMLPGPPPQPEVCEAAVLYPMEKRNNSNSSSVDIGVTNYFASSINKMAGLC